MLLKIVVRRSKKVDLDRFATIIQSFDNVMSYGESVLHRSEKRTYDNADRIKKLENEVAEIKKTLSEIRAHEEKSLPICDCSKPQNTDSHAKCWENLTDSGFKSAEKFKKTARDDDKNPPQKDDEAL